jgi:hypothetical protein
MRPAFRTAFLGALLAGLSGPAFADSAQSYTYTIQHPEYGDIGTYVDTVVQDGDVRRVETRMRVAVKVLGIVMFREEADRTEIWHGDRLVGFDGVTTTNGERMEVHGKAQGDVFLIQSPRGTEVAPADIFPTDPWAAGKAEPKVMMSTKSGKVFEVKAAANAPAKVSLYGSEVAVRHYEFQTDKHEDVWVDRHGIPVRFRTVEKGNPIDFVLIPQQLAEHIRGE